MKIKLLCLVIFFNFSVYATSNEILNENQIHKNLRCLVCQGQSISDSNSDFALTLKMVVKDLIKQGKTEEEIYTFLSDKYEESVSPLRKNKNSSKMPRRNIFLVVNKGNPLSKLKLI